MLDWEEEAMRTPYTVDQLKWMSMVIDLFGNKVTIGYITDCCLMRDKERIESGVSHIPDSYPPDIRIYAFDLIQAISATRKA